MSHGSTAVRTLVVSLGLLAAACTMFARAAPPSSGIDQSFERAPQWRAPATLWLTPEGDTLFVACSKSGGVLIFDSATLEFITEIPLGKSLVAMAATPGGNTLAVVDAGADELLIVDRYGREIKLRARVAMPTKPTSVVVDRDGRYCFVASRWSRVVSRVELAAGKVAGTVAVDFNPHQSMLLPDGKTLVVADAFSGMMALIDTESDRVLREVNIPGHNMRGMALSPSGKELLVTHMIVTESAPTTRDNVFWGITMTSNMRVIPIAALMDAGKNPVREAHTHFFGDPGNASGDPESLAILSDGTAIVCLAGVGEVAIGRYYPYGFRRVAVGQRPSALAISPDKKLAYVANAHSDTISVVNIEQRAVVDTIRLGPEPRLSLAEEGERLFYDAKLSLDGWFSCHSCHTDAHSNGHRADTFGDGSYGSPKTVLSLLGTADTEPWGWNGSKKQLEDQVRATLHITMQPKTPPGERSVAALTAYLRTLPPPPVADWQKKESAAVARGAKIFNTRGCTNCHAPPIYTNLHVYDVGIDDGEGGNRYFSPPSLRGVAHNAPHLHDGRAKTLQDVFRVHNHRLRTALADDDLNDLIAFLRCL